MPGLTIPEGFIACGYSTTVGPGGIEVGTLLFAPAGDGNPWSDPSAVKIVMTSDTYDSLNAYISGK
ncbi:MAG TPA: hypothetical protein VN909_00410 [Candidatus Dormibacteraeota bacterium]|jgi:hypothetical protein|nr:hypothetical protein [Candidatus Dormibacteraeota bacterium]